MANKFSNNTHNTSSQEDLMLVPLAHCIPWLVVFITECLAIVLLNIIAVIVFVKQRKLQRQSTYLIIHLAIVDLLVGAISGPLRIELKMASFCNLWRNDWMNQWSIRVKITLGIFPVVSLQKRLTLLLHNCLPLNLSQWRLSPCPFFVALSKTIFEKFLGCRRSNENNKQKHSQ